MARGSRSSAFGSTLLACVVAAGGLAACGEGGPGGGVDPLTLIGRGFQDAAVQDLARGCGQGSAHDQAANVKCLDRGFELNLRSDLSVGSVTLYNSGTGFEQYHGELPYGLSWDDTYPTVLDKLGAPDWQAGGNGVDVSLQYQQLGSLLIEIHFDAFHIDPDTLADARIRMILVST